MATLATPLLDLARPLTEPEGLGLLAAAGIATVPTRIAAGAEEALRAAHDVGWPVVLKGVVEGVGHKTEGRAGASRHCR